MRTGSLDSGKKRDSSCLVGTEVRPDTDGRLKLFVIAAKFWTRTLYLKMEDDVADIHRRKPFDMVIVEVNHVGEHVYEVLKYKKGMPVLPVTTSKDLKDIQKIQGYETMDKNAMVNLVLQWKLDGLIVFPPIERRTPEIRELVRQYTIFTEHTTESGAVSYRAEGQEHDDGVMSLLINAWYNRRHVGHMRGPNSVGPRDIEAIERAQRPPSGIRLVDG